MHLIKQITYQGWEHLDHEYTEKIFTYDFQNRGLPLGWGCISHKIFQGWVKMPWDIPGKRTFCRIVAYQKQKRNHALNQANNIPGQFVSPWASSGTGAARTATRVRNERASKRDGMMINIWGALGLPERGVGWRPAWRSYWFRYHFIPETWVI